MIYVKLIGRLGNQLFYYAIARSIQLKNPHYGDIAVIPCKSKYDRWSGTPLLDFDVKVKESVNNPKLSLRQFIVDKSFKVIRKFLSKINYADGVEFTIKSQHLLNKNGIYCMLGYHDVELMFNPKMKNIYISGVWENPYFFDDIRQNLLQEIKPIKPIRDYNKELYNEICNSNSVCISIRRGDFLKEGNESFNVCTESYFYQAVSIMKNAVGAIKLFVFSDDIEWCKGNLDFHMCVEDVYYENNDGNDPVWEKLRIMSACKHFIISNSTFSWWAQYLGQYKNKIVVAPRPWRVNEYCDCLYDSCFILLDGKTGK